MQGFHMKIITGGGLGGFEFPRVHVRGSQLLLKILWLEKLSCNVASALSRLELLSIF